MLKRNFSPMLLVAGLGLLRVSYQQTSTLPFWATESVPNQCQALVPGSVLIRTGALQFVPPLVLRANMTSHRFSSVPIVQSA